MVTKGSAAQTVRARRTSEDAVDTAPLKLKKKVLAGRGDHTSGSNSSPTSDASPTREHEHERSIYGHHDRTRLGPADSETTPRSRGHGPPPPPLPQTDSEQQHQHWQREREEGRGHEAAQSYANEGSRDEQTPSTPLVAIAPAKPGAMLPKDLIMAKYRVKPDAPKFLLMLYEILQHESNQVIRWAEDGLALQILDQANVTEKVLPKYFNHTNFHSFQRQLNYFGFRKWTKSKTDICTFSHPYFRRNQPELMHLIKRKKATRRAGANEQAELVYPTDGYTEGGASTSTSTSPAMTSAGPPKKLLPVSPSGKRRLAQDASEDGGSRGYPDSNGSKPSGSLPSLANHQAHLNNGDSRSSTSRTFLPSASTLTNAISPASGGAKKKAKTMTSGKSFHPPELAPSGPMPPSSMMADPAMVGVGMPPGTFPKGALPNLDLVRNRLIYRQPSPGSAPGPMPNFPNGFPIAQNQNSQQQPPPSTENNSHNMSTSSQSVSNSNAPSNDSTNSMFNNSFSDPVDILLRIKKSRAMSQDNTIVQSPQHTQGQVEGFASLQNFLLSQSMYTNRLESQLKLAVEENDALRHLLDAKQREVDSLLNERKMIQNENAVLTEDKNKLFEINRDLLSKLFPQ